MLKLLMDPASFVPMKCMHYLFTIVFFISFSLSSLAYAKDSRNEQQINLLMRTIGHEVMLAHGDSTSRVLPVKSEGEQYFIQFETEFTFQGVILIEAVDRIVKRTDLVRNYLVEMQECQSGQILYSYQVEGEVDLNTIPCGLRDQAKTCYVLRFLILENEKKSLFVEKEFIQSLGGQPKTLSRITVFAFLPISILLFIGIGLYINKKKAKRQTNTDLVYIGNYVFDSKNMTLSLSDQTIELSGKESSLLSFLYLSVNTTVGREEILRNVWGNEGDYVGRTLDVFISKLRKKLDNDPNVKIINIRGVGYRLVLDETK